MTDELVRTYFRVEVVNTGFSTTAPNNGFIDDKRVWQYSGFSSSAPYTPGTTIPTNLVTSQKKARGYLRWEQLRKNVGNLGSVSVFNNVDPTGGTIDNSPTEIDFTVGYDYVDSLIVDDETSPGTNLSGTAAISRLIARVFAYSYTALVPIFHPELDPQNRPYNIRYEFITAGPPAPGASVSARLTAAEANITVTQVADIS